LLALALPYSENPLIFAIGGLGSAILPWVTGILSQATNSLRIGLAAPVLVAVTMLLLALRLPKQPTPEENSAK
jgi:fucose permease